MYSRVLAYRSVFVLRLIDAECPLLHGEVYMIQCAGGGTAAARALLGPGLGSPQGLHPKP